MGPPSLSFDHQGKQHQAKSDPGSPDLRTAALRAAAMFKRQCVGSKRSPNALCHQSFLQNEK